MSDANLTPSNSGTANSQTDLPAARDDRRRTAGGGATAPPGGARRPRGDAPSSAAVTLVSILAMIVVVLTLVPFASVTLPDAYCIVKDSVTEQERLRSEIFITKYDAKYADFAFLGGSLNTTTNSSRDIADKFLFRCCLLDENKHRQLLSAYSNLSLPTMSDTRCLRKFPRCIIYPKERVECLQLRSRYGHNVLTLLEPWYSFTVYTREHGPGSVLCKHLGFSRVTAFVILATHAVLLVTFCYSVYSVLYVFTVLRRIPVRPDVDSVGRGGANDGSTAALIANDNARPAIA